MHHLYIFVWNAAALPAQQAWYNMLCVGGKARQQLPSLHSGSKLPGSGRTAGQMQHVQDQPEVLLGGTYFPAALTGQHAVNSVLNQAPGKLRSKDLKVSIHKVTACCIRGDDSRMIQQRHGGNTKVVAWLCPCEQTLSQQVHPRH